MKTKQIAKIGLMTIMAGALTLSACKKKGCMDPAATNYDPEAKKEDPDNPCTYEDSGAEVLSGTYTSSMTLTNDKCYELDGKVVIDGGATLTIEPGTVIKGQEGTGPNASALIIARGSKINAVGTASQPIIFTSVLDNIECGALMGTNLTETDNGKWGGLIILGYAPTSAENGDTEAQIEGIPATDTYGAYGGTNASDNSGSLSYISIRHGGALIGADNEINGLTLGGVGNGTSISNIEVVANLDDGIECFGGTVDITNAIVVYQGDDAFDIDQNYSGTMDNIMAIHGTSNTDEAFEIDGPEGTTYTNGMYTITNATAISEDGNGSGADLKSKAQGSMTNVLFEGYSDSKYVKVRASFSDTTACTIKTDAYTYMTDASPILTITSSEFVNANASADVADVYTKSCETCGCVDATMEGNVDTYIGNNNTIVTTGTTGANSSVFNSWTWASNKGKL